MVWVGGGCVPDGLRGLQRSRREVWGVVVMFLLDVWGGVTQLLLHRGKKTLKTGTFILAPSLCPHQPPSPAPNPG